MSTLILLALLACLMWHPIYWIYQSVMNKDMEWAQKTWDYWKAVFLLVVTGKPS